MEPLEFVLQLASASSREYRRDSAPEYLPARLSGAGSTVTRCAGRSLAGLDVWFGVSRPLLHDIVRSRCAPRIDAQVKVVLLMILQRVVMVARAGGLNPHGGSLPTVASVAPVRLMWQELCPCSALGRV